MLLWLTKFLLGIRENYFVLLCADILTCIRLLMGSIPYIKSDYTDEKTNLFGDRPPMYWSLKSPFRPFLVINGVSESREVLYKCLTKSEDMFLIQHQKNVPSKFGQLIIPVLPESILTQGKTELRSKLRNALNNVGRDQFFHNILSIYEQQRMPDEDVHLFIVMVCISLWIDLDCTKLLEISRLTIQCFQYFFDNIRTDARKWLASPCTNDEVKMLLRLVNTVSKQKTKFRVDMTVDSMVNVINAGHDAIYSSFLHLLKLNVSMNDVRRVLKESPSILAAGRHTKEVVEVGQHRIPPNLDVIISLKGISAFSYGAKSCVAKSNFAVEFLAFLIVNKARFNVQFECLKKFKELLLFIE